MEPTLVRTRSLSRRYGRRWALARLDLEVQRGERLLVVGANGSGKTTLLRVLATLLAPSLGELELFGADPWRDPMAARARLALLSHASAMYEDLSGRDNLAVVCELMGREADIGSLLTQVGLDDRPEPVSSYSAGMRKRLGFARLLAQRPELVLLDEPYGQLDPSGFDLVDALVERLSQQGATIVIASHIVERAGQLCPRAILLHQGQVRWEGPGPDAARAWKALHGSASVDGGAA